MEVYKLSNNNFVSKLSNFVADSLISEKNDTVVYVDNRTYRVVKRESCSTNRLVQIFLRIVTLNLIYFLALRQNKLLEKKVAHSNKDVVSPLDVKDTLLKIAMYLNPKDLSHLSLAGKFQHATISENKVQYVNCHPEVPLEKLGFDTPEKSYAFIEKYCEDIKCVNIKSFQLNKNETTKLLKMLVKCKKLTHLYLPITLKVDDECLKLLGELKHLEALHISQVEGVTPNGVKELQNLKNLQELSFGTKKDYTLDALSVIKQLQGLNLRLLDIHVFYYKAGLSDEILNFENLEDLTISVCSDDVKELSKLQAMNCLKKLTLIDFTVNSKFKLMAELSHLHNLEFLKLKGFQSNFTDLGLDNYKIETLIFKGCIDIKDDFLEKVSGKFKRLKTIRFIGCGSITEKGVKSLNKMKYLKEVSVKACKNVKPGMKNAIAKSFSKSQEITIEK